MPTNPASDPNNQSSSDSFWLKQVVAPLAGIALLLAVVAIVVRGCSPSPAPPPATATAVAGSTDSVG